MAQSPAPLLLAVPEGPSPAPHPFSLQARNATREKTAEQKAPSEATRQAPHSQCSRLPPVSVSSMDHRQLPCAEDQEPRLLPCTSFHFSGLCRTGRVPEATALPVRPSPAAPGLHCLPPWWPRSVSALGAGGSVPCDSGRRSQR